MLRRCHGMNLNLPSPGQGRFWCLGPSLNVFPRRSTSVWIFKELSFSVNFAWRWRDRPRGAVAVWRTSKVTTEEQKEKHALPSSRTTCFAYLTLTCDRLTPGRKHQQNEDIDDRRRSGAFEGVCICIAVQGRRLSMRSGPLHTPWDRWPSRTLLRFKNKKNETNYTPQVLRTKAQSRSPKATCNTCQLNT